MNSKVAIGSSIVVVAIGLGIFYFQNASKSTLKYVNYESLDKDHQDRVAVVSDELFSRFKISSDIKSLAVGDSFPRLKFTDVSGENIDYRNKSLVIVIGDKDSGFEKYLSKYQNTSETIWMVPYGELPKNFLLIVGELLMLETKVKRDHGTVK